MHTFSVEISDKNDLEFVLTLFQRLGLKYKKVEKNGRAKTQKKDLEYHRKIIEAGLALPEERLHEMLERVEVGRKDRQLPFRES